jgi:hypothetical protein
MSSRCVLLFARSSELEGRAKGLPGAKAVFDLARRRLARAVTELPGVALVIAGDGHVPAGARRIAQRGRTFGERFQNALGDAAALGFAEVLAVPADVPSLGGRELAQAFEQLAAGATPFGPSPDGGVYLIGFSSEAAPLLLGVRWRTPNVLGDLLGRVAALGGRAALLPPLRDVDSPRDLAALSRESRLDPLLSRLLRALLSPDRGRATSAAARDLCPAARLFGSRAPPASAPS